MRGEKIRGKGCKRSIKMVGRKENKSCLGSLSYRQSQKYISDDFQKSLELKNKKKKKGKLGKKRNLRCNHMMRKSQGNVEISGKNQRGEVKTEQQGFLPSKT